MLLVLVNIIWLIIKLIFYIIFFLMKTVFEILAFIFKKPYLRFPFLLISIGCLLKINFNILATIYFIYLMHLSAIKFMLT